MNEASFRSQLAAAGDDGQAFTLTFGELQAEVDAGKSPDLVAARVFSLVLPLDGAGTGMDISFATSGYAFVSEGARGFALLSVNGEASVEPFPPGTDKSFVQELRLQARPAGACHLAVVLLVQRDLASPDAAALLRPLTVDAEIHPRGAG